MGKNENLMLWVLVVVFIMLTIFNTMQIRTNHRRVDAIKECQIWLFEHQDNYGPVIITIIETQGIILEMIDELIIREAT